jgi:hypothetical protein
MVIVPRDPILTIILRLWLDSGNDVRDDLGFHGIICGNGDLRSPEADRQFAGDLRDHLVRPSVLNGFAANVAIFRITGNGAYGNGLWINHPDIDRALRFLSLLDFAQVN